MAVASSWYAFLTVREHGSDDGLVSSWRTDVFVSQFPMAGIDMLNGTTTAVAQRAAAPTTNTAAHRKRTRPDAAATTPNRMDPYARLRSATRVVDVLTVTEMLDDTEPLSFMEADSAERTPLPPPAVTPKGTARPPTKHAFDVYTLENMRREPTDATHHTYRIAAIAGPFTSRTSAIGFGFLWRHNIRTVESKRERGYELSLHFRLEYYVDCALAAGSALPRGKRRVVGRATMGESDDDEFGGSDDVLDGSDGGSRDSEDVPEDDARGSWDSQDTMVH